MEVSYFFCEWEILLGATLPETTFRGQRGATLPGATLPGQPFRGQPFWGQPFRGQPLRPSGGNLSRGQTFGGLSFRGGNPSAGNYFSLLNLLFDFQLDNYIIVDVGANLTNKKFGRDLDSVIQRAKDAGISKIMVTGTSVQGSKDALRLSRLYPGMLYATAGK